MKLFLKPKLTTAIFAISTIIAMTASFSVQATPSLGLQTDIVSENADAGSFPLEFTKQAAPIFLDSADWPGVLRAGGDLQADVERVTGIKPALSTNGSSNGKSCCHRRNLGQKPAD